jgi:paraquat-inducible protein B
MSDRDLPHTAEIPQAVQKRGWWPGLVWAIPLAALLIVAYLGLQALTNRGVDVVVTFKASAGARVGDTKVVYQGLEAGRVTKLQINKDGRRVDMTLRLDPRARPALNSSTQFWLIGAMPDLSDINSLKAALAGVTIGMAPGITGKPTTHFIGLEQPPVVAPDTKGSRYILMAKSLGAISRGTRVLYHGQEIGKVLDTSLVGLDSFRVDVFVKAPYDRFIRANAHFWVGSPLSVSLSGSSLEANLAPASTLLSGAVDFDLPPSAQALPQSPAGSIFRMYQNKTEAAQGLPGPAGLYDIVFAGPAGDLAEGSAVKLLGFPVGAVTSVRLMFDTSTGAPYTAVTVGIYPKRLGRDIRDNAPAQTAQDASNAVLARLLHQGYRAGLAQTPPLIGAKEISLTLQKGAGPAALIPHGDHPQIPAGAAPVDINDLTSEADEILAKVNRIPIQAIGEDVRQITTRLRTLVSSPKLDDSLGHLDGTLTQVDQMMSQVKPQVGPLIAKLNLAADQVTATAQTANGVLGGGSAPQDASLPGAIRELTDAARSIRSLADYLGRHPEAVLRGKAKEK